MASTRSSRRKAPLCVAYGTAPTARLADRIAREAIAARAAACVHRLPRIRSTYRWKGRVESAWEYPLLFKLRTDRMAQLTSLFIRRHPYECPGLASWPLEGGHGPFLDWIRSETSGTPGASTRSR